MDARTCDRCGVIWYDSDKCKLDIQRINVCTEDAKTGRYYDLCESCRMGLFDYLKPINTFNAEDKTIRIFNDTIKL